MLWYDVILYICIYLSIYDMIFLILYKNMIYDMIWYDVVDKYQMLSHDSWLSWLFIVGGCTTDVFCFWCSTIGIRNRNMGWDSVFWEMICEIVGFSQLAMFMFPWQTVFFNIWSNSAKHCWTIFICVISHYIFSYRWVFPLTCSFSAVTSHLDHLVRWFSLDLHMVSLPELNFYTITTWKQFNIQYQLYFIHT